MNGLTGGNTMYLCFDVGGTNLKAAIITNEGTITIKRSVSTKTGKGVTGVIHQFQEIRNGFCRELAIDAKEIHAVSIGVPGFVEMKKGFVTRAVNLGWKNVPITDMVASALDCPVFVINDANAAALGEMWKGAGNGHEQMVCLTLGTGVGGGVIANGHIINGTHGLAGEIGHSRVRMEDGRPCNCGKTGCLETEASASAIGYYGEQAARNRQSAILAKKWKEMGEITSKDVAEAAAQGDSAAQKVLDTAAYYLGLALANMYTITAPSRIVIGGGAAAAGDLLFESMRKWFDYFVFADVKGTELIVPAALGNDAGIIGLAKLADMKYASSSMFNL
jgi:glucokinase